MPLRTSLALPLLAIVLSFASGCLHRQPAVVITGVLHGEVVWEGDVRVGGDVILSPGARLTILPGTTVHFLPPGGFSGGLAEHPHFPGSELVVQGRLVAVGTPEAPITFRAEDETAPAGSWGALNFEEGGEGTFAFCIFRQADSAVHAWSATVTIEESLFEENLVGIRFNASRMRIEHNLLRNNDAGIRFHFGAPVVSSNRFEGNRINLFITSHPSDYLFENNLFGRPVDYQVVLGEEVPEAVMLGNNAWEQHPGESVTDRIYDSRRIPYLGHVQVDPMLASPPAGAGITWTR